MLLCMSHIQSIMVMTYPFYSAIEDFNPQSPGPEYGGVFRSEGNLNCWKETLADVQYTVYISWIYYNLYIEWGF